MPKLFFLEAERPLTKTFTATSKSSYPNVYEVTSHEEDCSDIADLVPMLQLHGANGHCLLKGALGRPLVHESRAGATNPANPTSWLCLDLDGVDMADTDQFMARIGMGDVSYVRQWSASAGLSDTSGRLRCHIFVFLDGQVAPGYLKQWLMSLNFEVPELRGRLGLSTTGMALLWTLDITTCQEDKLLYIAPPILEDGLVDPHPNRYEFVQRANAVARAPDEVPTDATLKAKVTTAINELRSAAGMPARKQWDTKRAGAVTYLVKPDATTVTSMKRERGFVYFNLNGGDSWAYFHPENNPYYIHNFKGEPVYRTEDLLPEYWAGLKSQANTGAPDHEGTIYLAFRDFSESNYYNAVYDSKNDDLRIAMAKGEKQLRDFMVQYGQIVPEYIPDWERIWDPSGAMVIDPAGQRINTFRPSEFMKRKPDPTVTQPPKLVKRIVEHMCAYDAPTVEWMWNWCAFILQYRQASGAAPVLHGTQGTGKGLFFHRIMTPLLGPQNVSAKRLEELDSEFFSGAIEGALLVLVDEVQTSASLYQDKVTAKLKTLITDPMVSVRKMYTPAKMVRNHANFVFASNKHDPVEVAENDRRFTIAPAQPVAIQMSQDEIYKELPLELEQAYSFLMNIKVDIVAARKPLVNAAKQHMIELNRTTIDAVSLALHGGDLQFFVDALPGDTLPPWSNDPRQSTLMRTYAELVDNLLKTGETKLTRDELLTMCRWCIGSKSVPDSPHKFTSYLRHHNITTQVVWRNNRSQRGFAVKWAYDPTWAQQVQAEIAPLLEQIRKGGN